MSDLSSKSPRQFIEKIRRSFLVGIGAVPEELREGAENLQNQLNNALRLLSEELYSKKSHFILELVQNADDNTYKRGVVPELTFRVDPSRLTMSNNEVGFSEANITAICRVGDSTKSKSKAENIGEKGIGFKSVFSVSNAPEIHSNGYHFRFDRTKETNLLGYVVPHWCEPHDDIRPEGTSIILPAAPGVEFDASTLGDLDARVLLFLNKLRQLTIDFGREERVYKRIDRKLVSLLRTEIKTDTGKQAQEELRYVRVLKTITVDPQHADIKRPNIATTDVVLAFPVNEAAEAMPEQASHAFAFLPVAQLGFKFPFHADFIVNSGREAVLNDRPWNKRLRDAVAETFVEALASFKKLDALSFSYLKFVPSEGDVADSFFRPVRASLVEALSAAESLPSASGVWSRPSSLRLADDTFRSLFPSDVALELFGFGYVDLRVKGGAPLLRNLGVGDAGLGHVLTVFESHGTWLSNQPLEWRAKFYGYIAENQQMLVKSGLLDCPCLPVVGGRYVAPSATDVFFPLAKGKRYAFEHELEIIDHELYQAAVSHSEQVPALFSAMRVHSDEPYDLVVGHILPRHTDDAWMTSKDDALVGHLRYVKDKLPDYIKGAEAAGKTQAQAIQLLREGIWIGTKFVDDSMSWHFEKISDLYLAKEYQAELCLESLIPGALNAANFVSAAYLGSKPKDTANDAQSWRDFFIRLGIRKSPALVSQGTDWRCSDELHLLLNSNLISTRRAVLECLSQNWSDYTGRMEHTVPVVRNRHATVDTQFAIALRSMAAPLLGRKVSVPLSEAYYPTEELRTLLGGGLPYVDANLSEQMLNDCHVTYRLDAATLVKRLKQLKRNNSGTTKQVQTIYRILDDRYWKLSGTFIREAFESEGLIQLKGTDKGWFRPSEVCWRSNGSFLDSLYPPLLPRYRELQSFFLGRIAVPREVPVAQMVAALPRLADLEDPSARRAEALAIYRRANQALGPRFGRDVNLPDWLETLQSEDAFVNQRGELVPNHERLFANNRPELAELFGDQDDISFLAIPPSEVPRLGRLLDAALIARLSDSVSVEVDDSGEGQLNSDLTDRIRRSVPYLARILYAKQPDSFAKALEAGSIASLWTFSVCEVPELHLKISLGGYSRETTTPAALGVGGRILYKQGTTFLSDRVATELSKYLGSTADTADAFARALLEDDTESVEELLRMRDVGALPEDLAAAVMQRELPSGTRVQDDDAQSTPGVDDLPQAPQSNSEEAEASQEEATTDGKTSEDASNALDHHFEPASAETLGERQVPPASSLRPETSAPSPGTNLGVPPHGSEPTPRPSAPAPVPTASTPPAPSEARMPAESGRPSSGGWTPRPPLEADPGTPGKVGPGPAGGGNGIERSRHPGGSAPGPAARSHRTRGGSATGAAPPPPRTKRGRLLSYVVGPGSESHEESEGNPAKVAAREATGRAAVQYFLQTQASRWSSVTEMPHSNPGFDVLAINAAGEEEFIEVKGQSDAWTQEGVALTPTELLKAQQAGERYWLCVVEFAQSEKRRQLRLLRNPFGLTNQFRFDVGWKSAAESVTTAPTTPVKGLYIDITGVGVGRIVSVRTTGKFSNIHVILNDGKQVNRPFNPAKMTLSKEPLWQE
jgi:hypothetical protein